MLLVDILQWWYLEGWKTFISDLFIRVRNMSDHFSIGLLLKTLFSPFRQISASSNAISLEDRFHAWVDKTISRFVGFFARTAIIIFGIIVILANIILSLLLTVIWPLIPFAPIIGSILAIAGVFA